MLIVRSRLRTFANYILQRRDSFFRLTMSVILSLFNQSTQMQNGQDRFRYVLIFQHFSKQLLLPFVCLAVSIK